MVGLQTAMEPHFWDAATCPLSQIAEKIFISRYSLSVGRTENVWWQDVNMFFDDSLDRVLVTCDMSCISHVALENDTRDGRIDEQ